VAAWKKAIEGLTPSGSEFVNDPEACAAHIRDRYNPMHTFKQLRQERDALRAALKKIAFWIPTVAYEANDVGYTHVEEVFTLKRLAAAALEQPAAQSSERGVKAK
jgi:hypothetical protein